MEKAYKFDKGLEEHCKNKLRIFHKGVALTGQ